MDSLGSYNSLGGARPFGANAFSSMDSDIASVGASVPTEDDLTFSFTESSINWSELGVALGLTGGIVSSGIGFYSTWQQASSYKSQASAAMKQAELQSAVESYNQKLIDEAYGVERLNMLKTQERRLSAYNAGYAASGIEKTGSALTVIGEQGRLDSIDLAQLDRNADRAAMQSQMNSISIMSKAKYESKALKRLAHSSKVAGAINLFGGLLGTAGSAAYKFGTVK